MKDDPAPVLLAAPRHVIREVRPALAQAATVLSTDTFAEALGLLSSARPALLVLSYVFDELRPFRLLAELANGSRISRPPILLLKATPVSLGETDEELRQAYRSFGVVDFFNLWDEQTRSGHELALERLRSTVTHYLRAPRER